MLENLLGLCVALGGVVAKTYKTQKVKLKFAKHVPRSIIS